MCVEREAGARTGNLDVTLRATPDEVRRNLTSCHDCHCDLGGGDCAVCRLSPLALRLLVAMREQALERMETHPDGTLWGRVRSDDITVSGMRAAQKAGYCAALMRVGMYRVPKFYEAHGRGRTPDEWQAYWDTYSGEVRF